jgi:predicted Rossmann fold nucleotide-binding protein DprA/Smf involved in DNA uptake
MEIAEMLGNQDLINRSKTAFLCSRKISPLAVLKCFDWAIEQRENGKCVISGFHSKIEKDVLSYLLKGSQPVIIVLARGLKENPEPEWLPALEQGRLLVISPFSKSVKRASVKTAEKRNKLILSLSEAVTVGYVSKGGQLENLLQKTALPVNYIS